MLDTVRRWLLTVTATALICGVVKSLSPEGSLRRAVSAVCAAAMMAAMLSILDGGAFSDIGRYVLKYSDEADEITDSGVEQAKSQTRFIIEERCETYILDKAAALGVHLDGVTVTARWSGEGFWYPASCEIRGDESRELSYAIEAELGIPGEEQKWSTKDEG